jgi:hypothetical protein
MNAKDTSLKIKLIEMDETVTLQQQLGQEIGPVILIISCSRHGPLTLPFSSDSRASFQRSFTVALAEAVCSSTTPSGSRSSTSDGPSASRSSERR